AISVLHLGCPRSSAEQAPQLQSDACHVPFGEQIRLAPTPGETKNRSASRLRPAAAASSEVSMRAKTLASKFCSTRCRYVPPAAAPPWVPAPPDGPAVQPAPPVAPVPPTAPMPPAVDPAPPVVPVAPVALAEPNAGTAGLAGEIPDVPRLPALVPPGIAGLTGPMLL